MKKVLLALLAMGAAVISEGMAIKWGAVKIGQDLGPDKIDKDYSGGAAMFFIIGQNECPEKDQIVDMIKKGQDISSYAFDTSVIGGAPNYMILCDHELGIPYVDDGNHTPVYFTAFGFAFDNADQTQATSYLDLGTQTRNWASNVGTQMFAFGNQSGKEFTAVPEPMCAALLALGAAALGLRRKRS